MGGTHEWDTWGRLLGDIRVGHTGGTVGGHGGSWVGHRWDHGGDTGGTRMGYTGRIRRWDKGENTPGTQVGLRGGHRWDTRVGLWQVKEGTHGWDMDGTHGWDTWMGHGQDTCCGVWACDAPAGHRDGWVALGAVTSKPSPMSPLSPLRVPGPLCQRSPLALPHPSSRSLIPS